jgi:hypothetical protein
MTFTMFVIEDDEQTYETIIEEEEFESDSEPQGYEPRTGLELREERPSGPVPWDPYENFFATL